MRKGNFTMIIILCLTCALSVSCRQDNMRSDDDSYETYRPAEGMLRIRVSEEMADRLEAMTDSTGAVLRTGVRSSDDILDGLGTTRMRRTFRYAGKFEPRTRAEGLHLWYDVYFDTKVPVTRAYDELRTMEGVTMVEYRPEARIPQYRIVPAGAPALPAAKSASSLPFNDPYLPEQWHYINDGSYKGVAGCDVNVLPVWEDITTGNREVIVAVVDGGVATDHEDLAANIFVNEAELNGEAGVDDDNNGYVDDIYGYDFVYRKELVADDHGTHVAGTIAAVNNNGTGVCGIAGGDYAKGINGVRIVSCQIFCGEKGGNTSEAIKYGADIGAVISQNSWEYGAGITIPHSDRQAIDYFIKYAGIDENGNQTGPMRGGIVVFAAGNESKEGSCPGYYEPVIAVTALGADYKMTWYTNYGDYADISAPGGDSDKDQWIMSTISGNRYGLMQGTSMACPHISAIAALIVSRYGGPGFTPDNLKQMLLTTTDPIIYNGINTNFTSKLGSGIVNAYKAIKPSETSFAPGTPVNITADRNITDIVLTFIVPADNDGPGPYGYNIFYSKKMFMPSDVSGGGIPDGIHKISVRNTVNPGGRMTVTIPYLEENTTYYVCIQAYDKERNRSGISDIVSAVTGTDNAPEMTKTIPDIILQGTGHTVSIDLEEYFTDRDGDPLSYTCTIQPDNVAEVSFDGSIMTVNGLNAGKADAKLKASDNRGKSTDVSFIVSVGKDATGYLCYPNPVTDILYIRNISDTPVPVKIRITSSRGNTIYDSTHSISASSPAAIDLGFANSGEYTVNIEDPSGTVATRNIVKL